MMYVSDFMVILGLAGIIITGLSILTLLLLVWVAFREDRQVERERRERIVETHSHWRAR